MPKIQCHVNFSVINDKRHYTNLHKHIFRTAKKYENIAFIMVPIFNDGVMYAGGTHMVVETKFTDPSIRDSDVETALVNCVKVLEGDPRMRAATVTNGENGPGIYIYPCIHILFSELNTSDMESIFAQINASLTKCLAVYDLHEVD